MMANNRGPSVVFGAVQWGPDRYPVLWLRVDGDRFAVPLHRCVALAHGIIDGLRFAQDPRDVHHIDGDHWNNHPTNLEAADPFEHRAGALEEANEQS